MLFLPSWAVCRRAYSLVSHGFGVFVATVIPTLLPTIKLQHHIQYPSCVVGFMGFRCAEKIIVFFSFVRHHRSNARRTTTSMTSWACSCCAFVGCPASRGAVDVDVPRYSVFLLAPACPLPGRLCRRRQLDPEVIESKSGLLLGKKEDDTGAGVSTGEVRMRRLLTTTATIVFPCRSMPLRSNLAGCLSC